MRLKIAVTGMRGQLACSLVEAAKARDLTIVTLGRPSVDLTDGASVERALVQIGADLVINAAAYTAVDRAESEPQVAFAVNGTGAGNVARACTHLGIPIIHISTDYVFDGTMLSPYKESDATAPINTYGRSKLQGEVEVARACPQHIILRTAWLHSPFASNFVKTMLRLGRAGGQVSVVEDQVGNPTYGPHLAEAIVAMTKRVLEVPEFPLWGVYHAAGTGEASWYDVAVATLAAAKELGGPRASVRGIKSTEYACGAKRPMNSCLDTAKLAATFGLRLPPWQSGIADGVGRLAGEFSAAETPS